MQSRIATEMEEIPMTATIRRATKVLFPLLATGVVVSLMAVPVLAGQSSAPARAKKEANEVSALMRWDIAKCHSVSCGALVGGGHAVWRSESGATFHFSGTGEAEPREQEAAGGGTWTRRNSSGHLVGRGTYKVTRFIDWHGFGGTLGNVLDAVGHRRDYRVGILKLHIDLRAKVGGRLVISSFLRPASRRGYLLLHTASGRTIRYRERIRPGGQPLFHRMR
jgi:hypothetical protein